MSHMPRAVPRTAAADCQSEGSGSIIVRDLVISIGYRTLAVSSSLAAFLQWQTNGPVKRLAATCPRKWLGDGDQQPVAYTASFSSLAAGTRSSCSP
jgi:hypothetical protein